MNKILKGILMVGEAVAVQTVPGAQAVDSGVRAIVSGNRDEGILDTAEGAIKLIENFKEADIADEQLFRAGVADLEAGFHKIKNSLKHVEPAPTPTT